MLHLWSLGVEEQFYLLWPLLVAGVAIAGSARAARRSAARLAASGWPAAGVAVFVLAVVGTAASTGWLVYGALHGVDASRLYYGTDTRALALLTGRDARRLPAAAAFAARGPHRTSTWCGGGRSSARWRSAALHRHLRDGQRPGPAALPRRFPRRRRAGGARAGGPRSGRRAVRSPGCSRSRRWPHIGRISYGLYLWHWPVILFFTGARTGLTGASLLGLRLGVSLVLAELSYGWSSVRC